MRDSMQWITQHQTEEREKQVNKKKHVWREVKNGWNMQW